MNKFLHFDRLCKEIMGQYQNSIDQYYERALQFSLEPIVTDLKDVPNIDLSWLKPETKTIVRDFEWIDNLVDSLEKSKESYER